MNEITQIQRKIEGIHGTEETKEKESGIWEKITENVTESETGNVTEGINLQEEEILNLDGKKNVIIMTEKNEGAETVLTVKGIIGGQRATARKRNLEEMMMQKEGIEEVVRVMKEIEIEETEAGMTATRLLGKVKTRYIV